MGDTERMTPLHPEWSDTSSDDRGPDVVEYVPHFFFTAGPRGDAARKAVNDSLINAADINTTFADELRRSRTRKVVPQ